MTTIYHDDDADLERAGRPDHRRRRVRQPGPLVGAEPARLRAGRHRVRARRRHPRPGRGRRLRRGGGGVGVGRGRHLHPRARRRHPERAPRAPARRARDRGERLHARVRPARPGLRRRPGGAPHARPRGAALLRGGRRVHHAPSACTGTHRPRPRPRTLAVAQGIGGLRQGGDRAHAPAGGDPRPGRRAGAVARPRPRVAVVHAGDARARHPASRRSSPSSCSPARSSAPTASCGRRATPRRWSTTRRRASTASSPGPAIRPPRRRRARCGTIVDGIDDGRFADEWDAERDPGYATFQALKDAAVGPAVRQFEQDLRTTLGEGAINRGLNQEPRHRTLGWGRLSVG